MKRHIALLFVTALWITGCSADGLLGPEIETPSAYALTPSTARTLVGTWEARDAFGSVELTITSDIDIPAVGNRDAPRLSTLAGTASIVSDDAPASSPTVEGTTRDDVVRMLLLKPDGTILAKAEGKVNTDFSALKILLQESGKPSRLLRFTR